MNIRRLMILTITALIPLLVAAPPAPAASGTTTSCTVPALTVTQEESCLPVEPFCTSANGCTVSLTAVVTDLTGVLPVVGQVIHGGTLITSSCTGNGKCSVNTHYQVPDGSGGGPATGYGALCTGAVGLVLPPISGVEDGLPESLEGVTTSLGCTLTITPN